ncbi:hypothetical protein KSP35_10930 [Aquihabitans sp. G128]|uniref:hypothetical protein n=1 Tax=Aquihabitans sp. G128 TaxID=2849779 RepID=UPI001C2337EA|nr:hypothetical protein [Aquihabitans sp. G128]QXC63248.1 hypothetical protein KSP35_10930 [Aquihabitans sp. G128]
MVRGRKITAAVLAAGALALGACGGSGSDDAATTTTKAPAATSTTAGTSSSTTAATASTTTVDEGTTTTAAGGVTTTTESSEGRDTDTSELDTLTPDGDHYGYMAGLEKGTVEGQPVQVLLWDEVELFTGQAAVDAAAEDGQTLETDYYVRNENQTIRHLAVVPDASVTSLDGGGPTPVPSSVDEVWQQQYLFKINVGTVRGVTTISGIEGVYLP